MLLSLLLPTLLRASPPAYSATVVDAATNQPLAGVSALREGPGAIHTSTDARGRFVLAGSASTLDLSLLGYAPLHLAMLAQPTGSNTLRLLPCSYALDEVAVRPPQANILASVPSEGPELGWVLYPGQAVALPLARPTAAPAD